MLSNKAECCRPSAAEEATRSAGVFTPAVDIVEDAEKYVLRLDVPGARAEDIDVQFDRGEMTVRARVQPRPGAAGGYMLREYGVGDFERSFRVGEGIDTTGISAEVASGVLTLTLPKSAEAKPRKIAVTGR